MSPKGVAADGQRKPSNSPKRGPREKFATYLNANASIDKGIKFGEYLT